MRIRPSSIPGRFQAQINGIRKNSANYTNDFQKLALRRVLGMESAKIEVTGVPFPLYCLLKIRKSKTENNGRRPSANAGVL
jgi:hypothetical protein